MEVFAHIENIRWSVFDPTLCFNTPDGLSLARLRLAHITYSQACWITLRPVIDAAYNLYNPKAPIFLILN